MAQHKNVPKFGDWETEKDVPYTAVFDKARSRKNGVKMSTNNIQKNPKMFSDNVSPVQTTPFKAETISGADAVNIKVTVDSPLPHHGSENSTGPPKRVTTRQSVGSDRRIEHSPLHPQYQAKTGTKGSGMPSLSLERKGAAERGTNIAASLAPGRSRMGSMTQVAETREHRATVPEFGKWDELDPSSADGYTRAFKNVRDEKLRGTGNVSAAAFRKPYYKDQKQQEKGISKKVCCFPIPW